MPFVKNLHVSLDGVSWELVPTGNTGWTISGDDIYNNNSGNVGIGTVSPATELDVYGVSRFAPKVNAGTALQVFSNDLGCNFNITAPPNGDNNGPFVFNTANSWVFQCDSLAALTIGPTRDIGITNLAGFGDDIVGVNPSGVLSRRGGPSVAVFELDSLSPTNVANTTVRPEWSSLESNNTAVTLNGTNESVQFNENGWFRITIGVRVNGDNRVELIVTPVRYDVTDDASFNIPEFETSNYALVDTDQNTGSVNFSFVKFFNGDDELYFDVEGDADGTAVIQANGTYLIVEKMA